MPIEVRHLLPSLTDDGSDFLLHKQIRYRTREWVLGDFSVTCEIAFYLAIKLESAISNSIYFFK